MSRIKSDLEKEKELTAYFSNPGSKIEDVMDWITDEKGKLHYVKTGERNIYEYIQAGRDTCDMAIIIERIKNGETNLLNVNPGKYGDITEIATNFNEAYQQASAVQSKFDSLDPEIKAVFGNNYETFVESVLNNTIDSLLAKGKKEEEVKQDE